MLLNKCLVQINNLLLNQFKIFTASPSLVSVIFSEELFRNEVILQNKVSEIMNNSFETLKLIIKGGQIKEEIRTDVQAEHLAIVVMGSLRLFVKQWTISNYEFNLTEKGNELMGSINILLKK